MKTFLISAMILLPSSYAMASTQISDTDFGKVYTDSVGKSLYTFAKDPVGKSVCVDDCEKLWPPLLAEGEDSTQFSGLSAFSKITRADGTSQWAIQGKPLYRWFKDTQTGDITGAGVKGVWPLARADDVTVKLFNDGQRRYLVDSSNQALYTFDKDKMNQSTCYGDCEVKWPPAYVDSKLTKKGVENLKLSGGFGIAKRDDQSHQWTFQGKPLYRWFKDKAPGETSGDGVKNVWHLVIQ
ncbi:MULTISPECIES: hypothetical protein [Vibrio]|uniref:hypothetical protein n=1 Tax=Vibrio TaxID=662 RepID=UPI002075AF3B|nr:MULTISPECIES: hypothetical protein [Vibrio]USD31228.1 hypothetical protein J8Z27_07940 [Vibrio sp. SCSIO 43186]USD44274.1 hypothetical protein J4N38_08330 [Vibrio sp. SCSIO 43145]USD68351.1 hypothetical protein J4N41_07940 [Vibrio sp. SCSIO 43139]USD96037.1 hypothetical protein CTT30_08055 [Vibrio coralliilyticus]